MASRLFSQRQLTFIRSSPRRLPTFRLSSFLWKNINIRIKQHSRRLQDIFGVRSLHTPAMHLTIFAIVYWNLSAVRTAKTGTKNRRIDISGMRHITNSSTIIVSHLKELRTDTFNHRQERLFRRRVRSKGRTINLCLWLTSIVFASLKISLESLGGLEWWKSFSCLSKK